MKYLAIALTVLLFNACDYKEVDEGKAAPKSAMKCGAGKCGAAMMEQSKNVPEKKAPAMKCAPGKCGAAMMEKSSDSN